MAEHHIEIDGISITVIRKPIKNMNLRIYPPDGRVQISAPLRLNIKQIHKWVETKREWLHTQRAKLQDKPVPSEPTMEKGEQHYFLGQPYTLTLVDPSFSPLVVLKDNQLLLSIKENATALEKHIYLKKWYLAQMKSIVPELIKKWQPIIGVQVVEWGAKTMKTRWGSCNVRTRRIWLNLVLIQKPILCLEYVLVHEMVHLLEASHNARFYQLMDKFMPDWRSHKTALYLPAN